MEPTEIEEFSKQMQEGGESGLKTVSLVISVLAVLVAMVTVLGHRTHTEAVLSQTRAADQWNEYQAKKIRLAETGYATDLLSLQPSSNDAAVQKKLGEYKEHIKKWNDDLAEESKEATSLEVEVKLAESRRAPRPLRPRRSSAANSRGSLFHHPANPTAHLFCDGICAWRLRPHHCCLCPAGPLIQFWCVSKSVGRAPSESSNALSG